MEDSLNESLMLAVKRKPTQLCNTNNFLNRIWLSIWRVVNKERLLVEQKRVELVVS